MFWGGINSSGSDYIILFRFCYDKSFWAYYCVDFWSVVVDCSGDWFVLVYY